MAPEVPRAPDRRPEDPPPDPAMAQGGRVRGRPVDEDRGRDAARCGGHSPNNVAKTSLIPDSVISRTRLRPTYGHGWQPRLDPRPRQADGRALGEVESI